MTRTNSFSVKILISLTLFSFSLIFFFISLQEFSKYSNNDVVLFEDVNINYFDKDLFQKYYEKIDVENLSDEQRSKLRIAAEDLTKGADGSGGTMAFFTRSSMSDKINKLIDAIGKVGGKTGGVMGLVDILGMKKEYDKIKEGESLINKLIPTEKEFSKQVFKDGGVIDIFDTD